MSRATDGAADPATEPRNVGPPSDAEGLERDVWDALGDVMDLHIPFSLVEIGMIYDVTLEGGEATVEMTYPCMGCPAYEMLQVDIERRVSSVPGVEDVAVEVVWDPLWTKDMIDDDVREDLEDYGIGL